MKTGLVAAVALLATPTAPAKVANLTAWTTAGSRVAFVAPSVAGKHGYLWTETYGAGAPHLLRTSPPIGEEEIDALALGPHGTLAALERTPGAYRLDVVSSRGGGAAVASITKPILLVGDGTFLGYLIGADLYRIAGARGIHVATLAGVTSPQEASVANGHLAVRETNGSIDVFTTGGAKLSAIAAKAASVALTANRVVVRTRDRHLAVYGLGGGLVHDWRLAATSFTSGLAAYGAYAVYLGANKAVHAVRLVNGADRVVGRAGSGLYANGVALQKAGALFPLTVGSTTTFRFVPTAGL